MNIANDKVTEYIGSLYRPLSEHLAELRKTGEKGHIPIILKDSERLLVCLVEMLRPARILEIGTAIGYSAAVFATACVNAGLDTEITTVEADPLYAGDARRNLTGYDNVTLVEDDGCRYMNEISCCDGSETDGSCGGTFDLIFIDAAKSHYREFWDAAVKLTRKGSVIVCDNILMQGKTVDDSYDERGRFVTNIKYMRDFLDYISSWEGAATSLLSVGDGMSISVIR